jgi:two-component system cell cycle response regulator DivK
MEKPVLLIEDNDQNRYLTTFLLEKNGFRVVTAIAGLSGIEMAKEVLPGLILLDIQLPRLDGYQVARLLRQDRRLQNVPIIAVTSYAMNRPWHPVVTAILKNPLIQIRLFRKSGRTCARRAHDPHPGRG